MQPQDYAPTDWRDHLREGNRLISRALRLQDAGKFAEADALLDEAERLTDLAEGV